MQRCVEQSDEQRDQRQLDTVKQHHRQRGDQHHAVEHAADEAAGEHIPKRPDRTESGLNIADVALAEIAHRQIQHMSKQTAAHRHAENTAQVQNNPGSGAIDQVFKQHQSGKRQPGDEQQIPVRGRQHLVYNDLHVIRRNQDKGLQCQRQQKDLRQSGPQAIHAGPEIHQAQFPGLFFYRKRRVGQKLNRNTGKGLGQFLQGEHHSAPRRIVNDGPFAGKRFEHHVVLQLPVQNTRQGQVG